MNFTKLIFKTWCTFRAIFRNTSIFLIIHRQSNSVESIPTRAGRLSNARARNYIIINIAGLSRIQVNCVREVEQIVADQREESIEEEEKD
ncbi:hypothetical protein MPH47_01980 [Psychrobacillus psychrodurans]|uniref:hypothetical protein n=1 Tax=Psychrobacillus psychrodurans TaxID=126157 RepID=UPI001F4D3ABC|nr:hypothetical protein [Psychrobacillus psychrodurans]MCK1996006.1 hypothetical protein [Psychrobacillus psychrodurans]